MRLVVLDYGLVKRSGLFDERYYLRVNPDCRRADSDPLLHYLRHGAREGRNPSASFNTRFYQSVYPDVAASGMNPLVHYIRIGRKEGRQTLPEGGLPAGNLPPAASPVVAASSPIAWAQSDRTHPTPQNTPPSGSAPAAQPSSGIVFAVENLLPATLEVGLGTCLLVRGWCFAPGHQIKTLQLQAGGKSFPVHNLHTYRDDVLSAYIHQYPQDAREMLHSGFWGILSFAPLTSPQPARIELVASLEDGTRLSQSLHTLQLLPPGEPPLPVELPLDPAQPRLAICMATYNPPLELFKLQLDSLRRQTFSNWICIINDDHSRPELFAQLQAEIGADRRFFVYRNDERLGHYHNFEAALHKVPAGMDFIAFADQDDDWYPAKLAKTLAAFKSDSDLLAYCDMDVLSPSGEKLSNTYWFNRRNNFTDLQTLLYANTVTGAASVFRASLLPAILPFPHKLDDIYHDHWVACIALSAGNIQYVSETLYAYQQHGANAYGIQPKIQPYTLFPEFKQYLKLLGNPSALNEAVKASLESLEASYNSYLLQRILLAKTLLLRLEHLTARKRGVIQGLASAERSASGLFADAVTYLLQRGASLGYELLAYRSLVGHRLRNRLFKLFSSRRIRHLHYAAGRQMAQITAAPNPADGKFVARPGGEDGLVRLLKQMIAPLQYNVSTAEPPRVNLLMATVDFNYIFGGYLAMFNLAKKIGQMGNRVRIVIVEPCAYKPKEWRVKIQEYPGLEDLFDYVETSYNYDRSHPLEVNPQDIFIATSCWTAHIASQIAGSLNGRKFIFFAQEYEPIFFPMGSSHALAEQSYCLPQFTIFSTELLRQYFRQHSIGIYRDGTESGDASSLVINNAIHAFDVSLQDIAGRRKKRFLFYARPEAHAARNLYELGLVGLESAVQQGLFSSDWEFYGIGTIGNNRLIPLSREAHLTLLPKVSLKEYLELIPTFDLGMSLMLSPHPSLVPLEMAAAGMPTITNTYANKTALELSRISPNLIGIEPTVEGIVGGLAAGLKRVGDYPGRVAGAHIHWPTSWSQVFDPSFEAALRRMMREC